MNRPAGRTQPPTRPGPPAPPVHAGNGGNGGNGNGGNGEPLPNTIDADQIYAEGITAAEALDAVLGERRSGNNQADFIAACRQIEADILQWEAAIIRHRGHRSLILHLAFNDYARRSRRPEQNNWAWVAFQLRKPLATVHKWAHYIECLFSEKDQT